MTCKILRASSFNDLPWKTFGEIMNATRSTLHNYSFVGLSKMCLFSKPKNVFLYLWEAKVADFTSSCANQDTKNHLQKDSVWGRSKIWDRFQMKMHKHCPNSDLILLSRCGHFPMLERSTTTSTLLLSWLQQ